MGGHHGQFVTELFGQAADEIGRLEGLIIDLKEKEIALLKKLREV